MFQFGITDLTMLKVGSLVGERLPECSKMGNCFRIVLLLKYHLRIFFRILE